MTILINDAKALKSLPEYILAEIKRLEYMIRTRDEKKSASGFTQKDISRQIGYVSGLKEGLMHILQEEWCKRNNHAVPFVTGADVDNFLDTLKDLT